MIKSGSPQQGDDDDGDDAAFFWSMARGLSSLCDLVTCQVTWSASVPYLGGQSSDRPTAQTQMGIITSICI